MFNCQSEMAHKRWFSLDLMGVSIGLIGCYFPGAYYAFHCHLVRSGSVCVSARVCVLVCVSARACVRVCVWLCVRACVYTYVYAV